MPATARTATNRQTEPRTPDERRQQALERREWLRRWTREVTKAEGKVPTLKRTREAMHAKFGRVLANAYINSELQKVRGGQSATSAVAEARTRGVPFEKIQHMAQAMYKAGLLKLEVDADGHLIDAKARPLPSAE